MTYLVFLQADGGGIMSFLPIIAMILVLYLFMIRPQMQKQKKEKQFQSELKKGTKVITTSGIHGKIVEVHSDNTITIETGAGKIKFERSAISLELSKRFQKDTKPTKK